MAAEPTITYTHTDEAPALATMSFLPVLETFCEGTGIAVETKDISLAGRILSQFPERLRPEQRVPDHLAELGRLTQDPGCVIIKLPNISASTPQLRAAIDELRAHGYDLPDYVDEPTTDAERDARARYDRVKGSAVNPVLREGNSDRRAPKAVKDYARANPHRLGAWEADSPAHVASMTEGDFRGNERSVTVADATTVRIELVPEGGGDTRTLKDGLELEAGEVVDASFMSARALRAFLAEQVADARATGVLFSVHLKATMMKVSDPIIFGHAVRAYFADVFETHADALARAGADPNSGLAAVLASVATLPESERAAIEADVAATIERGPGLAMVNSHRGITCLHVPNDVIIDASMPVMIRDSGCMWNAEDALQPAKAVIPDRCYAGVYEAVIEDCKANGAYDPTTMGSIPNVGLMARKAEEYGSHDTTFELDAPGTVRVVAADGTVLLEHAVEAGDIWRMCRTKHEAIVDWVCLAVARARATGSPAVFWLDQARAHDAQLIEKVGPALDDLDTDGLDLHVMAPVDATRFSVARLREGEDTISVTGNVLRDYLTDLFPILEVGTSAKMLSIVPLMNGGGLLRDRRGWLRARSMSSSSRR